MSRSRPVALFVLLISASLSVLFVDLPDRAAARGQALRQADYVIIAGVPGLRWDDVSQSATPTLWRMAQRGAIGSLAVRSAHVPTCPADGWVTMGAGNFAQRTAGEVPAGCPKVKVDIEQPDGIGANLPDQPTVVEAQQKLPFGAVPGALAESVRCTTAVGPGAAIAAARAFGRVDRYEPVLPQEATGLLSTCILSIVGLGVVDGVTPQERSAQVAEVEALLARLQAQRPERSTIIVAGVSDTDQSGRLHVVVIDGPGWLGGWLNSATTGRRDGYLELVDLAPTALHMLGRESPKRIFAGGPAAQTGGRPPELADALAALADADHRAATALDVGRWFFTVVAGIQIALFALVIPLLWRNYRHAGPAGPRLPPRRMVEVIEIMLVAVSLALPAAMVADIVPWWRTGEPSLVFGLITLVVVAVLALVVLRLPAAERTLVPLGVASCFSAAIVCADLLTGARLQLNSVVGYSALQGGRYAGLGIVVMGVFIAGALMAGGWLAHLLPQRYRTWLLATIGGVAVVAVGSPNLGADAGGAVALTAGLCLAAALAAGGWLTFGRLAWAVLAGFAVTLAFALVDVRRPVEQQGSLGRLLDQFSEGTASLTLHRVALSNASAFATSALTVLAVVSAIFVWAVLMRPWGGLKRLFGIYPVVRAAATGVAVATLVAGLLGGAALNVAGAAAATALPLLTLSALRVLEHAADRTRTAEEAAKAGEGEPGPAADTPASAQVA